MSTAKKGNSFLMKQASAHDGASYATASSLRSTGVTIDNSGKRVRVTGARFFHSFTVECIFRGLIHYVSHYELSLYTHIGHRRFHSLDFPVGNVTVFRT